MKVKVLGKQFLDFKSDEGNNINGVKLHVASVASENTADMQGNRVATIFTKLNVSAIPVGAVVDLVYDVTLGSKVSKLVSIDLVK